MKFTIDPSTQHANTSVLVLDKKNQDQLEALSHALIEKGIFITPFMGAYAFFSSSLEGKLKGTLTEKGWTYSKHPGEEFRS